MNMNHFLMVLFIPPCLGATVLDTEHPGVRPTGTALEAFPEWWERAWAKGEGDPGVRGGQVILSTLEVSAPMAPPVASLLLPFQRALSLLSVKAQGVGTAGERRCVAAGSPGVL